MSSPVKIEYREAHLCYLFGVRERHYEPNKVCIIREDKIFEVKMTYEGIIIDVYSESDGEFVGSPFSATYDEMSFEAEEHG